MLNNWFYSHSIWEVAAAVCFVTVVLPLVGLYFFHKVVPWNVREEDTSMVGLSYALCGGIFAVVLAFVAVGVYEAMDKTTATAAAEANSLCSLVFDSAGMPKEVGSRIREEVDQYIDTVTEREWPSQQAYHMEESNFEQGWNQVRQINTEIAAWEPATPRPSLDQWGHGAPREQTLCRPPLPSVGRQRAPAFGRVADADLRPAAGGGFHLSVRPA